MLNSYLPNVCTHQSKHSSMHDASCIISSRHSVCIHNEWCGRDGHFILLRCVITWVPLLYRIKYLIFFNLLVILEILTCFLEIKFFFRMFYTVIIFFKILRNMTFFVMSKRFFRDIYTYMYIYIYINNPIETLVDLCLHHKIILDWKCQFTS